MNFEFAKRLDLRDTCTFTTIDNEYSRDLDDALHCNQITEDMFEIGVIIGAYIYQMLAFLLSKVQKLIR